MRQVPVLVALMVALLVAWLPDVAPAQQVGAVVRPDSVRVGDVFQAAVRIELPAGMEAAFPDSLPLPEDLEPAGSRTETVEPLPGGGARVTAVYPLTAWRPGEASLPTVAIRVSGPEGARTIEAPLPAVLIRAILPADTAGLEPRPLKDVLGASRLLWPWLLALLAVGMVGGGLYYWRRRGRAVGLEFAAADALTPRERALAALESTRALGLVEAGAMKEFYSLTSAAVRTYLEELNAAWGAELTTSELVGRLEAEVGTEHRSALARLLGEADLVKFAGRRPGTPEAHAAWEAARVWVESFHWIPPGTVEEAAAPEAGSQEVA